MSTLPLPPIVRCCTECGVEISGKSICGVCIYCQKKWGKTISNPRNFEGRYFKFKQDWFAPVQMATGEIFQSCIAPTAGAAWAAFTRHYWTKKERMAQGWRVKRIRITPDWTPNGMDQRTGRADLRKH